MAHQIGDTRTELSLPAIDGNPFSIEQVKGKRYMICFMCISLRSDLKSVKNSRN